MNLERHRYYLSIRVIFDILYLSLRLHAHYASHYSETRTVTRRNVQEFDTKFGSGTLNIVASRVRPKVFTFGQSLQRARSSIFTSSTNNVVTPPAYRLALIRNSEELN